VEVRNLNLLTLCSGIGSPELGAERVYDAVNIVAACEIDPFARKTYEANFDIDPNHYHHDVTTMDATHYNGNAHGLVGGFPCQAFSFAGKRLGFEDTRGTIFYDFVRILKEVEPEFFIFENVKGLVGHDKEKDTEEVTCSVDLLGEERRVVTKIKGRKYFSVKHENREIGRTLHTMEQVLDDAGYYWTWEVLNTKDFGVPQNRERIFMVGFKNEKDFKNFSFPKAFPLERRLKDVLEEVVDDGYYLSEEQIENISMSSYIQNRRRIQKDEVCDTLCARDFKDPKCVVIANLNNKGHDYINRVYSVEALSPTLPIMQGGGQEPKILQKGRGFNKGGIKAYDGVVPALTSCSWQENNHLMQGLSVRKLTPLECLRLQDFPDSFKKVVSNSQLYKQAGNSMSVNVMELLFKQVKKAMSGEVEEVKLGGLFAA